MYIQGKNKNIYTAKMNTARSTTLLICGVVLAVIGIAILLFGIIGAQNLFYSSDKDRLIVGVAIICLVLLLFGGGSIANAVAMKSVFLTVYDVGIYGKMAKISPISGFLTKTQLFDIKFDEITGIRLEKGILFILRNSEELSFVFSIEDARRIQEMILETKKM